MLQRIVSVATSGGGRLSSSKAYTQCISLLILSLKPAKQHAENSLQWAWRAQFPPSRILSRSRIRMSHVHDLSQQYMDENQRIQPLRSMQLRDLPFGYDMVLILDSTTLHSPVLQTFCSLQKEKKNCRFQRDCTPLSSLFYSLGKIIPREMCIQIVCVRLLHHPSFSSWSLITPTPLFKLCIPFRSHFIHCNKQEEVSTLNLPYPIHFPLLRCPLPPLHIVCARFAPPPALALSLSHTDTRSPDMSTKT